jgi:MFS family permease
MAARFFLGVGEASIAPGFALITGMFYKREEQPARQAAWFIGNSFANVIGGVVAYGIGKIQNNGVNSWQLIFLILGAVTAGYALMLFAFLPDSPATALFLSKTEKAIAVQRTLENKTGVMDTGKFKWKQVRMALKDPQTWFLVLYTLCVNFCNGGLTSFSAIIITGFGFSTFNALLVQMPIGGAQLVFLVLTSGIATFVRSTRILMMILNTAVSMTGMIMIWKLDDDNRAGKMVGLCFGAVFAANIPLALSLITSNVAGFTKKSVISALVFIAYCVGNIVGPQFFLASEDPHYPVSVLLLLKFTSSGR